MTQYTPAQWPGVAAGLGFSQIGSSQGYSGPSNGGAQLFADASGQIGDNLVYFFISPVGGGDHWLNSNDYDAANTAYAGFGTIYVAQQSIVTNHQRINAVALLSDPIGSSKLYRALLLIALDEINLLRQWIEAFKAETAASLLLTDFQARVATLPAMPNRTASQLRTAITGKVNSGAADS